MVSLCHGHKNWTANLPGKAFFPRKMICMWGSIQVLWKCVQGNIAVEIIIKNWLCFILNHAHFQDTWEARGELGEGIYWLLLLVLKHFDYSLAIYSSLIYSLFIPLMYEGEIYIIRLRTLKTLCGCMSKTISVINRHCSWQLREQA